MKALLVTNTLYPYLNANSEIVYKLAAVLKKNYGCSVTVLGYSNIPRISTDNPYDVEDYEMREIGIARSIMARHESRLLKILRLSIHPKAVKYLLQPEQDPLYRLKSQYRRAIQHLCEKREYDCIVCFKNPNDTIAAAIVADVAIPIIAYELDPWEAGSAQSEEELHEQQYNLEKECAAVITTKLLYPNYLMGKCGIPIDRVYQAEFPNISRPTLSKRLSFQDGRIHCVFAGQLYGDIRNPRYAIDLFSHLTDDGIVLDIFGNDNGCLRGVELPENVIYHGEVQSDDALAYLCSADVVVNIGNTLMNQMPSKIYTCISTGKPILNIVKSEACPTLRYTTQYPYVLNLVESVSVPNEVVYETKQFCRDTRGRNVDFEMIEKMYHEATPEFVGGILYEVLNKCTDKV